MAALVPVVGLTATPASAASDPKFVNFTLEGCRNNGTITLPNSNGKFVCPDAAYTTGNLGKGWNELDLVPHRVTTSLGTQADATTNYTVAFTADNLDGGVPGYDVISTPTVNTAKSAASCQISDGGQQTRTPGVGGTDTSIYRMATITQNKGTTCVFDYFERLALGSHNYPGSSLHSNLMNQTFGTAGVGGKDVSIPVKEILPQELSNDMTATQGSDHIWNIVKSPNPATLNFENTCLPAASARQKGLQVTVTWTKLPASPNGDITVLTHVYGTNPAARTITVNTTDTIRSGTTVLETASSGPIDVPANTDNALLLTHQTTVPSGTADLNDIATATYTDKVTGVPVPGSTQATASATVQPSGATLNTAATVNDVESITGTNLRFSTDGFSGASGSFDGGYTTGTATTGPVSWTSGAQSTSGSVTFDKTVYVTTPSVTSGTLSDTATLNGSDGFTAQTSATVNISTGALVSLVINKTIPNILGTGESESFQFQVKNGSTQVATATVNFGPGQTESSATVPGLDPGVTYTIHEVPKTGWTPQLDQTKSIDLPSCSESVTFTNTFGPASARVRKVTFPSGHEAGWEFHLSGPGGTSETVTTTGTTFIPFTSTLTEEGTYTVTEVSQAGWANTGVTRERNSDGAVDQTSAHQCTFTVGYPADADALYSCVFTNTQQGTIIVKKVTEPTGTVDLFTFSGALSGQIADGGQITTGTLTPGTTYTVTEADPTPAYDLVGISCDDNDSTGTVNTRTASYRLDAGETITCTFTNRQRAKARVVKTVDGSAPSGSQSFAFQLRSGATSATAGTILESGTADAGNGGVINFSTYLVPGTTYQLCETVMPGWNNNFASQFTVYNPGGDNSVVCTNFTVSAGETKTFNVDNHQPGGLARTIGFWKNWSSCDGAGRQAPVLDRTLALAEPGGVAVGDLVLHGSTSTVDAAPDCLKAIRILDKSRITDGKKMASDPAFNLAAQLLAAKLNVLAGAGTCPAATTAISAAQALLDLVNFDGVTHANMTSNQKTSANNLANTLDLYNNNNLC
jgi:hypothetical protein